MPVREVARALRGRPRATSQQSLVMKQAAIVAGVCLALWFTGWLLGLLIAAVPSILPYGAHTVVRAGRAHNILRASVFVLSLGTLAFVLATVEVARLLMRVGARPGRVSRRKSLHGAPVDAQVSERVISADLDSGTFGRVSR
jgi:hypothetical protein